jgi:diguanylate cyclase (GGDEF)-like protein/PAS domain S-box-containing protein
MPSESTKSPALHPDEAPVVVPATGLRPRRWTTWAVAVNAALLLLYVTWLPIRGVDLGTAPESLLDWLATLLAAMALELQLVLAIAAWSASRSPAISGRRKLGWRLFAFASAAYWIGNLFYTWYSFSGEKVPFPSPADVGYLAFYPLAFAALVCFAERREARADRAQFWLDAATVLLGVGTLVWYFLLEPISRAPFGSVTEHVLAMIYPLLDTLVLFGIIVNLLRHGRLRFGEPLAWIMAGMAAHFVADAAFAYQSLQGPYEVAGINGALYNAAYLLMLIGAHIEHRLAAGNRASATDERSPHRLSILPYASMGVAFGLLLVTSRGQWDTRLGGLILAAVALTFLVVARQVISSRENARLRGEQATRETAARFSSMVRHSSDVISLLGPAHEFRFVSPAAARVYGYEPEALLHTSIFDLLHPKDRGRAKAFLDDAMQGEPGATLITEWRLRHSDGRWRDIESVATNLADDPAMGGIVLNSRDVTDRKQLEEQLRHLAFHDPLTRLANRTLLRDRVEHALVRSQRGAHKVTLLFLDLDNFKAINDGIGHAEGDRLLKETAARLLHCCRTQDTVARLGGDEFAILIEDPLDMEAVVGLAQRIATALAEPLELGGREVIVTTSIGIAQGMGGDSDVDALVRNADVAMYAVKNRGKRGYAIFEPGMHAAVIERVDLEADFAKALERGELRLLYQPVVELGTGGFAGVEALLRWHHPKRGVVPPSVFIGLAEENSELIVPVGRWVLHEACRQGRLWQDARPGRRPHIAVNISVRQLQYSDLVEDVSEALQASGLDPHCLVLEITESAMMQRTDAMLRTLDQLRSFGVRLGIDDFGVGYSSLSYLHRFPLDILKIDKVFVDSLGKADGGSLTPAIIALGHSLKLEVIAEGVEHASQAETLVALGCRLGQGYHFSRPVTAEEIDARWIGA